MRKTKAFTLIELVIAMAILAVLSSIAAVSLSGTINRYQLSQALEIVQRFDSRARRDAVSNGTFIDIAIDQPKGNFQIGPQGRAVAYQIPSRVEITGFQLPRKRIASGKHLAQFNPEGHSTSYALQLTVGQQTRWIVFLGMTGQSLVTQDERVVHEILSL